MKVKKVLSLALAVVMIFTMIPAQLILSNAGYTAESVGDVVSYNTVLTKATEAGYVDHNCIKVVMQAAVDYDGLTDNQKAIVTLGQVLKVDTSVLVPVSMAKSSKGVSTLDIVKTNASVSPAYAWSKQNAKNNLAMEANTFENEDEDEVSYPITTSAVSYNTNTGIMYVHMCAFDMNGIVWLNENTMTPIITMYLQVVDGKTWAEVKDAINITPQSELLSTDGTGCQATSMKKSAYASSLAEQPTDVTTVAIDKSQLPSDPVPSTKVKITFNWKAVEEGAVVNKTTGEVEYDEGDPVTAPENSENDYSTAEYDYEFTGWSPALAEGATATEDTVYTAQYQPKAVDKEALDTEYQEDKGLVQEDYEEKVPGAWNALQDALAEAERVLGDQTASKVDVANALAAIEAAMANLTPKTPQASYNVTFKWQNGAKSDTTPYDEGATVQAPEGSEAGYVSADGRTKYTFTGWKDDATGTTYGTAARIPAVAGEASYTAQYDSEDVIVKITFNWANAEGPQTTTVDKVYGDAVSLQDAPIVDDYFSADGDTKYEFTGWSPATFAAATEPATYTAQFNEIPQYADYTAVDAAMLIANAKMAETDYADKYTPQSRQALADAIIAVVRGLPQSQQTTVEGWAADIEAKANALTLNTVLLKFITEDHPEGIPQEYTYGDAVTAPTVAPYTDDANFTWTFDGWSKTVPTVAKYNDVFTANYSREDAASTAELQQAVNDAEAKRDNGTNWTQDSVNNLNNAIAAASNYLQPGTEFPASQQGAINQLTDRVNAAADALTPAGATEFDVTFNWKVDGGENANDTTTWSNGQTPTAPAGSENGYETTDYTYAFVSWEPSIVEVNGANQVYNAVYDNGTPKYAVTTALEQAIADARAKMAEDNYEDKYAPSSREALENALATAQDILNSQPLMSQTAAVETATTNLNNALVMDKNQFTITFYTHENPYPQGIDRVLEYGDEIIEPPYNGYSEGDYDYTPNGWLDENDTPVEVPATATGNAKFYANYTPVGPIGANYDDNTAAVTAADDVLNTPNADKIYTDEYLQGIQNALQQNVDQGLGRSQQGAVNDATQRITDALANPQYKTYTIRFINEGDVISTDSSYHYNDTVVTPADPSKAPTVEKVFTFTGWDPAVTTVTQNQDYTATYQEGPRPYTVTYAYHNAQATEAVNYGALPQNPPTVPEYIEGGVKYTFDHWTPEFGPVTGPATYTAVYNQERMPDVTVTFRYALSLKDFKDGKLTDVPQTVTYGEMPVEPDVKSFTDGDTTYKFDGWDKTVVAATEEATYTAIYTPVTEFVPDMSEINALVSRYNQMVKTGKYNKDDLKAVKVYIDEIYDTTFTSQDEVNRMAAHLKALEDAVGRIDTDTSKKESRKESYKRRFSTTARTGDTATLVVMSVILVSSLGIAFISLKKRRNNI